MRMLPEQAVSPGGGPAAKSLFSRTDNESMQ
jgi:hypothetical protein